LGRCFLGLRMNGTLALAFSFFMLRGVSRSEDDCGSEALICIQEKINYRFLFLQKLLTSLSSSESREIDLAFFLLGL